MCNDLSSDLSNLKPSSQEEADTRLFLQVYDMRQQGYDKICICTVDTDVVVIALYAFHSLNNAEVWVEFSTGVQKKWVPIHNLAMSHGRDICLALPFWYAFTGCDTV